MMVTKNTTLGDTIPGEVGTVKRVTVGRWRQEEILVYLMDDAEFRNTLRGVVKKAGGLGDAEVAGLLRTIEKMDRFALGTWLADRGCGCLVGEALIAGALDVDGLSVEDVRERASDYMMGTPSQMVSDRLGVPLLNVGHAADTAMAGAMQARLGSKWTQSNIGLIEMVAPKKNEGGGR